MVDAAIGGKTAINLKKIKNQIGVFALPEAVYIYPGFLHSLDRSMVRSGMAEVLKYGLILDESLWKKLETVSVDELMLHSYKDPFWEEIILRSVRIKNRVVQEDFTEKGIRKILNFGHSFGHAFESLSMLEGTGYLLHGNAIAMGMICESYLSSLACGLKENDRDRIINWILGNFEFYPVLSESFQKIMEILQQDKKRTGENLNFTLLSQPGKAVTGQHCDQKMVLEAFSLYQKIRH